MRRLVILLFALTFCSLATGQTCRHANLSKQLDILTDIKVVKVEGWDTYQVSIAIVNKSSRSVQQISFTMPVIYDSLFYFDCNAVRSYSLHVNDTVEVVDNYFGDVIVTDLNFDNLDDVAVVSDMGGNGGTFYSYYIQTNDGQFTPDKFLTDSMTIFPVNINKENRTLTRLSPAGCCSAGETVFQYYPTTHTWKKKSHRFITD